MCRAPRQSSGLYVIEANAQVMTPVLELPDLVAGALEQRSIGGRPAKGTVINGRRAAAPGAAHRGDDYE